MKVLEEIKVSVYENVYSKKPKVMSFLEVIIMCIHPVYATIINTIRRYYADGDHAAAQKLKNQLPCFTPAGTFNGAHAIKRFLLPSHIVGLDYDHVKNRLEVIQRCAADPHTVAAIESPTDGVKVFAYVEDIEGRHREGQQLVSRYYNQLLGLESDPACKDESRLCYFSYSPNGYVASLYQAFTLEPLMRKEENSSSKNEKLPPAWIDSLLIYTMVGTVVGARLGHCLFYDPGYYLANPIEIFKVWEGGLASHGGTLGIVIAIYFYSRRITHKSMLWTFDKLVVPTGLVAAMIRLGNLMNHEIYGHPTDLPWGFRFIENLHAWKMGAEPIFTVPSHPTQLYEALCYLVTFGICMWLYFIKKEWKREGLIFGVFMICVFGSRIFIEFLKNNQEAFEDNMMLNMGQWLSVPFVLAGCWFVWRALTRKPNNYEELKIKK